MMDLKKNPEENEQQYIWRLGQYVKQGLIKDWRSAAKIINEECRADEVDYRDESAYRKAFQYAELFYENVFSLREEDEYLKELQLQKDEIYKLKRQMFDQRREYNKMLTADARADHLSEYLIEIAQTLQEEKPLEFDKYITYYGNRDAIISFADWHYGMVTDNIWNQYDTEICKKRVVEFVNKAKAYLILHHVETLHILLLGDCAHGGIHTTCRVASEEETCDQLMHVAEIMAEAINELNRVVAKTKVYSTYGNHLRTIQNKQDSIHSDNMEKLIPWWLKQRFQNQTDIEIIDSEFKEFIVLNVRGYNICCTHGDLENIKNFGITVNTLFTKLYGVTIDYTISADKHHLEEFEQFGIESILVRSLCGTDDYANNRRLYGSAGQSLFIFSDEDGREATYNIRLK